MRHRTKQAMVCPLAKARQQDIDRSRAILIVRCQRGLFSLWLVLRALK